MFHQYTCLEALRRTLVTCLHSISVWERCTWSDGLGQPLGSSEAYLYFAFTLILTQILKFLTSYVKWLCPTFQTSQIPFSNKFMQKNTLNIMYWLSLILKVFNCFFVLPDLSSTLNFWSWITKRLAFHFSSANMINEVWHRLNESWNEVIQNHFYSMRNRLRNRLSCKEEQLYNIRNFVKHQTT